MKWFGKFKIGQKVKVVKKIGQWNGVLWAEKNMNRTINKTYKIIQIDPTHGYQLFTEGEFRFGQNYWYPEESLVCVKDTQLLFNFMFA